MGEQHYPPSVNLASSRRQRLDDVIAGALIDCIKQHGPIDERWVRSASKRISGSVTGYLQEEICCKLATERLHKKMARLKYGHARLVDRYERLRAQMAELTGGTS